MTFESAYLIKSISAKLMIWSLDSWVSLTNSVRFGDIRTDGIGGVQD